MNKPSIALVGIGGYGRNYVKALILNNIHEDYSVVGVVDPYAGSCPDIEMIKELNIPIYDTLEELYANPAIDVDLVIISSPIHFHKDQSCLALSKGSHVLCEKPMSATVGDALEMIKCRNAAAKHLAIGYQWSFSSAVLNLKQDIMNGLFGEAKKLRTIVLWPRGLNYFSRGWAGKKFDSNGNAVFDSVANNAAAHYLHNMFYVLGDEIDKSAIPVEVRAELYRANDIENFDTAAIRAVTQKGVEIFFYASHAVRNTVGPVFSYEFEKGTIHYEAGNGITAKFFDGSCKDYGNPVEENAKKVFVVMDSIRQGHTLPCGPEAAFSQVMCIKGIQESVIDIVRFPEDLIKSYEDENEDKGIFVEGLEEMMLECYKGYSLPADNEASWSKSGNSINLIDYINQFNNITF